VWQGREVDDQQLAALLDGADAATKRAVWEALVAAVGSAEASRRWMDYFGSIDAPVTG
jgi:hypothetical protein